jgi:hypothetical protein
MKTIMLGLMLSGLASAVMAVEPAELDNRIRTLTDKFEAFQHRPDNGIPSETLRKASFCSKPPRAASSSVIKAVMAWP